MRNKLSFSKTLRLFHLFEDGHLDHDNGLAGKPKRKRERHAEYLLTHGFSWQLVVDQQGYVLVHSSDLTTGTEVSAFQLNATRRAFSIRSERKKTVPCSAAGKKNYIISLYIMG